MAAKESMVLGRVGVAVEEWVGRLHDAQRGSTVLVLCTMSRTAIHDDHGVKLVIYLQYRFRAYTPE